MPAPVVVNGAALNCTMATPPGLSSLVVLPLNRVAASGMPAATVMDFKPIVNIPSFGMCTSMKNPQVAAATAKLGVFTPQPCTPVVARPWMPPSPTVRIGGTAVLNSTCKCQCEFAGLISVRYPGQTTVTG